MNDLDRVFSPKGELASAIPGYRERPQQLEMAGAIWDAIESTGVLVAEAGTGTGKTFAYLVPALLAGNMAQVLATLQKGIASAEHAAFVAKLQKTASKKKK